MRRSITARLDRLEPCAEAAWRRAWEQFADRFDHHVPDERLERIEDANLTDEALGAYLAEHGLEELTAWLDRQPFELVPDVEASADLARWPTDLAVPPDEPPGVWDTVEADLEREGEPAALAAVALFTLGAARAVREVHS